MQSISASLYCFYFNGILSVFSSCFSDIYTFLFNSSAYFCLLMSFDFFGLFIFLPLLFLLFCFLPHFLFFFFPSFLKFVNFLRILLQKEAREFMSCHVGSVLCPPRLLVYNIHKLQLVNYIIYNILVHYFVYLTHSIVVQ